MSKLIFLAISLVFATYYCAGANVSVDIKALSDETLQVNAEFKFKCNATLNTNIFLAIDGIYNNTKMNRIVSKRISHENSVEYTFQNTTAYDNGTTFMCSARMPNSNKTESISHTLTIQIQYAPYFEQGNNITILKQFFRDKNGTLTCTVLMANPPIETLSFVNTSKHFDNVHAKASNGKGQITFSNAKPDNRGTYSCVATNTIGSTTLTYNTFVGGVPDRLDVTAALSFPNETLLIGLGLDDKSDAPALSMVLSLQGLIEDKVIRFQNRNFSIPVRNLFIQEVDQSLKFVEAGNYTLIVQAFNQLGNRTILNETRFIEGFKLDVNITSSMQNVTQGMNYSFTCNTKKDNVNFSVMVDYNANSSKLNRIVKGKKTNKSQEFVFTKTSYQDNGTIFQCVAEGVYKSDADYMIVLYPPEYFNTSKEQSLIEGTNVTFNLLTYTSNPEVTKFVWRKDGIEIKSNAILTVVNETALMFHPLLKKDKGEYTVTAENSIGSGNGTATLDVLWLPELISPVTIPTLKAGNGTFEVILNISANPPVTFTRWVQNGHDIINITNISPGRLTMTFTSLLPADNGSYSAVVYNEVGNLTVLFNMMVLYPPIITLPTRRGTFVNSTYNFTVSVAANPTNYTIKFMKDGKELKPSDNIKIDRNVLTFIAVQNSDGGNYTVKVTNVVGSAERTFELAVYNGPFFEEGASNSTVLTEVKDGSNFNITCTVKSSVPQVTELMIIPDNGTNFKTVKNGIKSVTLVINKAEAKSNTRPFICMAINKVTTSTLTFDTYVGGPPNNLTVKVAKTDDKDKKTLTFSLTVTDNSKAPATGLLVHLEGAKANKSLKIKDPPLKGATVVFKNAIEEDYSNLGGGVYTITIYGVNQIGRAHVMDYNFTIPSTAPKTKKDRSKAIKIGVGVSVPILVLIIIVAIAGGYFYYKKRSQGGYTPIKDDKEYSIQE